MAYKFVDKPIKIGNIELKNRIVRPAHVTAHGKGIISDAFIAYHEARARGGAALSILEVGSVHPSTPYVLNLFDPVVEPGFRKLVETIKPYGMKLIQQLWHAGHHIVTRDGTPPWSASDIPSVELGTVPIPMTKAMIDEIIAAYASCAKRCEEYGLDGVEVHCAHGYLPAQFLSTNTNKREDEYNGSFENRARFALEVVEAVRGAVSRDFVVGIRVAPDLVVNGLGVEDNLRLAQMFEERKLIDYVNISLGNYNTFPKMIGGMFEPLGYELPTSAPISRAIKLPTMVIGRYRTLEEADQCIRDGDADMVGMVRAMIADPDLVVKSLAGNADRVRPCIACNQGCIGGILNVVGHIGHMGCAVNPAVGAERFLGEDKLVEVNTPKNVLVIGGGPAGMEAARVAATRGHKVCLVEASPHLGGTLQLAARAPTRHGMMDIAVWLEQELNHLGVDIQLNTYLEFDEVMAKAPDAVIVATGSQARLDGIHASHPGQPVRNIESARVCSGYDVMASSAQGFGQNVVVVDDVGHYEGLAVSEYLVEKGLSVTYVTRQRGVAPLVQSALMVEPFLKRMAGKDFNYRIRCRAVEVIGDVLLIAPTYLTGEEVIERLAADNVVFISANRPNRELYAQLQEVGVHVAAVGDANSPRYLETAIREGHMAGLSI